MSSCVVNTYVEKLAQSGGCPQRNYTVIVRTHTRMQMTLMNKETSHALAVLRGVPILPDMQSVVVNDLLHLGRVIVVVVDDGTTYTK